jgi:hypothetical protein
MQICLKVSMEWPKIMIGWWRTPKLLDGLNWEGVGASSLACNILGVKGRAGALR